MTAPGRRPEGSGGPDHAEEVLSQALRALAGGSRQGRSQPPTPAGRPATVPFTRLQIVLLAILLGLLVGMTAGVISLLA